MQLTYLGPAMLGMAAIATDVGPELSPSTSRYLVEVRPGAGVEGEIIEGDVLVIDEARPVQHGDLAVIETDDGLELFRSHRVGGAFRLTPAGGGEGLFARGVECRGVVVQHPSVAPS